MNERLKEMAEQAGLEVDLVTGGFDVWFSDGYYIDVIERFAELVRQDEREACAVLVEGGNHLHPKAPDAVWAKTVARLIRARSEPSQEFKNYMGDNWAGIV